MAIVLGSTDKAALSYQGVTIVVEYRKPTQQDYLKYQAKNMQISSRKGNTDALFLKHNLMWGEKLLVSFEETDADGNYVLVRSDGSPVKNSDDDWRELLSEYASPVLANLALYVFASSTSASTEEDDIDDDFLATL